MICKEEKNERTAENDRKKRQENFMPVGVIQQNQLDDGWSPVMSDFDRVTDPKT